MDLQEFYRQAHDLRTYTPTVVGGGMTINTLNINRAHYLVLGRIVIVELDLNFGTAGVAATGVTITMPVTVETSAVGAFVGGVDLIAGIIGITTVFSATELFFRRFDNAVWTLGAAEGVRGFVFYENGEPIV